jgi:integral membrane sensor domain MASE1
MGVGEARLNWVRALAIGVGYGVTAYVSLSITRFGGLVEAIWISNALLTWALVTSRPGQWWAYFLFAAAAHVSAHLAAGDPANLTGAFLLGDMSECLIAGLLLRRRPGSLSFASRGATLYFLLACGLVAPLASTVIMAVSAFAATGQWLSMRDHVVWFSVDALALVLFLPVFYATGAGRWKRLQGKLLPLSLAVIALVGIAAVAAVSGMPLLRLLVLPLFVIVAFELGVVAVQICLVTAFIVWTTLVYQGNTPQLFGNVDMRDSLLLVQVLIAIFTASFLPLAVVIDEKQRLNDRLTTTLEETREAWGAIIGAEARYRLVVDNVSETVMRVQPGGKILFASPACSAVLHSDRAFEGRNLVEMIHPDERDDIQARAQETVAKGLFNLAQRWRVRIHGDDEKWYAIDARVTPVKIGKSEHEFIVVLRSEDDTASSA